MQHIVVGTAGHIDHGKTSLVRALTGIDTDRLEEEKRRGISIDLGFAHLDNLEFIDVPGHERFIKNMLAGVAGIDVVLMVIAVDESIKPQTREHFDICRLLGIRHGLVALTKSDLVDADLLELVQLEVAEFVQGSFLENAPVIPVSATTRAGLGELRTALGAVAAAIRGKDASRYPRLPVDRSFSMKGYGAVVTGTLISGRFSVQDEVEIYPAGVAARIRGLQVHGQPVEQAQAGDRVAVNLGGVDSHQVHRGMALAPRGVFRATQQVDTVFDLLPGTNPLKHRAPVHFHAGTAEIEAQVRLLASLDPMRPGTQAHVRFALRDPLLLLPGDRFIVRMFSPVVTIGGGMVLDVAAPLKMRRAQLDQRLTKLENGTARERVALLVSESKYGMSVDDLVARTGLRSAEIGDGTNHWLVDPAWVNQTTIKFREILKDFHRKNPLQPGLAKEELRSRELAGAPPFLLEMLLAGAKDIVSEGEIVRLASHRVALKEDEAAAVSKIEALFREGALAVPTTSEVLSKSGVEPARARTLLQILLKNRKLVRVGDDLIYHASAIESLRGMLAPRKGARFSVTEFKDWTGVSRKYAIPLLEFLDKERVTRREGDSRIVN
jgi:selenocysteine-specific elongation factor